MNLTRIVVACLVGWSAGHAQAQPPRFDAIIRHGTVIDGSGQPRFDADIGVRNGFIAAIGDLAGATAVSEIEARGLFVAPGFINIHSHAQPDGLTSAANMLTQGVTTEILNSDGASPLDIGPSGRGP